MLGKTFAAIAAFTLVPGVAPAAVLYTVTDLGNLGGTYAAAEAISNLGRITGGSLTASGNTHAFLHDGGTMTDLGSAGLASFGFGVNDSGQVVGNNFGADRVERAFLSSGGVMTDLGTLGGTTAIARGINATGQVTGNSTTAAGVYHGFIYSDGAMTDLGTLGGATSFARGINDIGQVVGSSTTAGGAHRAFVYHDGVMTDLGTLRGSSGSDALAINNLGQIVGSSGFSAFLYDNGEMINLGSMEGTFAATLLSLNDRGDAVGLALDFNDQPLAIAYGAGGFVNLNELIDPTSGWVLSEAHDVNNSGLIVGYGELDGQTRGFLLTPIDGATPDRPVLPGEDDPDTPGFDIPVEITDPDQTIFVDPVYAIGYDFSVDPDGPLFTSVLVPGALPGGDTMFELLLGAGTYALTAGVAFDFTPHFAGGVSSFGIRGIDVSEMIDPTDPYGFVAGLTFSAAGSASVVMNPITIEVGGAGPVPEPATWAMMIGGFGMVGGAIRRRGRGAVSASA